MNERKERTRTSDADQNPERTADPLAGLYRLKEALRHILKVLKLAVADSEKGRRRGSA